MRWSHTVPALLLAGGCATHRGPAAPALVAPMDQLAFYVGHWTCDGVTRVGPGQPAEEHWTATVDVEPELDGRWVSVRMTGPGSNRTVEHKGFDPATNTWHHVGVVNDGSWFASVSKGWDGNSMELTPDPPGDDPTFSRFTRVSDTHFIHAELRRTDAGEEEIWSKSCRKG